MLICITDYNWSYTYLYLLYRVFQQQYKKSGRQGDWYWLIYIYVIEIKYLKSYMGRYLRYKNNVNTLMINTNNIKLF